MVWALCWNRYSSVALLVLAFPSRGRDRLCGGWSENCHWNGAGTGSPAGHGGEMSRGWLRVESNLRLKTLCSGESPSVPLPREALFQGERCDRPLKSTSHWPSLLAAPTEDGKRIWELGGCVLEYLQRRRLTEKGWLKYYKIKKCFKKEPQNRSICSAKNGIRTSLGSQMLV